MKTIKNIIIKLFEGITREEYDTMRAAERQEGILIAWRDFHKDIMEMLNDYNVRRYISDRLAFHSSFLHEIKKRDTYINDIKE